MLRSCQKLKFYLNGLIRNNGMRGLEIFIFCNICLGSQMFVFKILLPFEILVQFFIFRLEFFDDAFQV